MTNIENEMKLDIIGQHLGENLAEIVFIENQIETTISQDLIDEYRSKISDLLAQNAVLESLKQTLIWCLTISNTNAIIWKEAKNDIYINNTREDWYY